VPLPMAAACHDSPVMQDRSSASAHCAFEEADRAMGSFSPSNGLLSMDYAKLPWPESGLDELNLLEPPTFGQAAGPLGQQAAGRASAGAAGPLFGLQAELRPSAEEDDRRKRSREAIERESLETFLRELGKEPAEAERGEPQPSSSGDEKRARQPTDAAAAARAKAGRERARRERLNERCGHLIIMPEACASLALSCAHWGDGMRAGRACVRCESACSRTWPSRCANPRSGHQHRSTPCAQGAVRVG